MRLTHDHLVETITRRIEAHCAATGLSERAFGTAATGDHGFMERLRARRVTLRSLARVEAYLAENEAEAAQ